MPGPSLSSKRDAGAANGVNRFFWGPARSLSRQWRRAVSCPGGLQLRRVPGVDSYKPPCVTVKHPKSKAVSTPGASPNSCVATHEVAKKPLLLPKTNVDPPLTVALLPNQATQGYTWLASEDRRR